MHKSVEQRELRGRVATQRTEVLRRAELIILVVERLVLLTLQRVGDQVLLIAEILRLVCHARQRAASNAESFGPPAFPYSMDFQTSRHAPHSPVVESRPIQSPGAVAKVGSVAAAAMLPAHTSHRIFRSLRHLRAAAHTTLRRGLFANVSTPTYTGRKLVEGCGSPPKRIGDHDGTLTKSVVQGDTGPEPHF